MTSINRHGQRWSNEGAVVVYDISHSFLAGDKVSRYLEIDSLVAWWKMSTISDGTINDRSGNGFHMTQSTEARQPQSSAETPSSQITAVSAYFDGGDIVTYETASGINNFSFGTGRKDKPFSIAAWVRYEGVSGASQVLFSKGPSTANEYRIVISTSKVYFYLTDNTRVETLGIYPTVSCISADTWTHLCFTYDGRGGSDATSGMKIYIDGEPLSGAHLGTSANPDYEAMSATGVPLAIGGYSNLGGLSDVTIADAGLWKTDLRQEAVTALVTAGLGVYWQTRNFRQKGSTIKNIEAVENAGLDSEDFIQGTEIKSMRVMHKSVLPKIKSNIDPILTRNGKLIDQRWFDDLRAPANFGAIAYYHDAKTGGLNNTGPSLPPFQYTDVNQTTGFSGGIQVNATEVYAQSPGWKPATGSLINETLNPADILTGGWESTLLGCNHDTSNQDQDAGSTDGQPVYNDTLHIGENPRHRAASHRILRSRASLDTGHSYHQELIPNHYMDRNRDLGMSSLHDTNDPFVDIGRFRPEIAITTHPSDLELPIEYLGLTFTVFDPGVMESFVHFSSNVGSYGFPPNAIESNIPGVDKHLRNAGASYSGIGLMDGVIEPFPLRSVVDLTNIDIPFTARGVRGQVGDSEDSFRRQIFIDDQIPIPGSYDPEPFWLDTGTAFAVDVLAGKNLSEGTPNPNDSHANLLYTPRIGVFSGTFSLDTKTVNPNYSKMDPFTDSSDIFERTSNIFDKEIRETLHTAINSLVVTSSVQGESSPVFHGGTYATDLYSDGRMMVNGATVEHSLNLRKNHVFPSRGGFRALSRRQAPHGITSVVYAGLKR